jgi:predicted enzyme related to lactoylglutathione lyase
MDVAKLYAVVSVADIDRAHDWYSRLFGRKPDVTPMPSDHEWHVGNGGVQVVADATRAGKSMLTVIVSDLEQTRTALQSHQLVLGPASTGDYVSYAQILDPDGNTVTFAQPK